MTGSLSVLLGIIGNVFNAAGYVLQKLGWNRKAVDATIWSTPLWIAGVAVYGLGGVTFAIALGMGSASILLPLGGLKLVLFAASAPFFLEEQLGPREIVGILFICVGIVGAVTFSGGSSGANAALTNSMLELLTQPAFISYVGITAVVSAVATYAVRKLQVWFDDNQIEPGKQLDVFQSHALAALYALLAGVASSYGVVFIKLLARELSVPPMAALHSPGLYLSLTGFILTNAVLEYWRQSALAVFPAMHVIPICEVSLLVLGITANGLLFGEFRQLSATSFVLFWSSIVASAIGIYLLTATEDKYMSPSGVARSADLKLYPRVAWRLAQAKSKSKKLQYGSIHLPDRDEQPSPESTRPEGRSKSLSPLLLGSVPLFMPVACWCGDDLESEPADSTGVTVLLQAPVLSACTLAQESHF